MSKQSGSSKVEAAKQSAVEWVTGACKRTIRTTEWPELKTLLSLTRNAVEMRPRLFEQNRISLVPLGNTANRLKAWKTC